MLSTLHHTIDKDERMRETIYWSKGVLGLKTIKVSVCEYITKQWQTYLLEWKTEELVHLPHFFNSLYCIRYQKEKKEWKMETTCRDCPGLFEKVLRMQQNPKSAKLVWNPDNAQQKFSGSTLIQMGYMYDICNICNRMSCIFHAERKGIDLRKSFTFDPAKGHTKQALDSIREYYWRFGNMFMFHGREKNSMKNTSPADTDPALVFKMMKNCKLFEEDDELYDEVLEVRNYLMHSSNQRIPKDDFNNCIEVFNEFLTKFEGTSPACYYGKREIEQLVSSPEMSIENIKFSKLYDDASKIQTQAITFDIHVSGRFGISKYELQGILNNAVSTKSSADENQDLRTENKRLRRLITDLQREINEKNQTVTKLIPEVGDTGGVAVLGAKEGVAVLGATGGATTGATIGVIGGPPGMIIGGAVGALVGGISAIIGFKS